MSRAAFAALGLLVLAGSAGAQDEEGSVPGRLEAVEKAIASAGVDGRVGKVLVRPGDRVEAGQVLVELANREVESRIRLGELDLRAAELERQVSDLRLRFIERDLEGGAKELAAAEKQIEEARDLVEQGVLNPNQLQQGEMAVDQMRRKIDEGRSTLEMRKLEMEVASANIERARIHLDDRKSAASELRVRAPISGVVGDLGVDLGAWIERGSPVATIVVDDLVFVAELDPAGLAGLEPGRRVPVAVDGLDGRFDGILESIAPVATEAGVPVRVRLELPPEVRARVRPGLFARAWLAE